MGSNVLRFSEMFFLTNVILEANHQIFNDSAQVVIFMPTFDNNWLCSALHCLNFTISFTFATGHVQRSTSPITSVLEGMEDLVLVFRK